MSLLNSLYPFPPIVDPKQCYLLRFLTLLHCSFLSVEITRPPGTRVLASAQPDNAKAVYGLKSKVRITTRCMWIDHGRLLNVMQADAQRALKNLPVNQPLTVIEKEIAQAIRTAVRRYSNKRPDVVVIAHESPWAAAGVEEASTSGRAEEETKPSRKAPKSGGARKDRARGEYNGASLEESDPSAILARAVENSAFWARPDAERSASGSGRGEPSANPSRRRPEVGVVGDLSGLATRLKQKDLGSKRQKGQRMTATATLSPDGTLELGEELVLPDPGTKRRGGGAGSQGEKDASFSDEEAAEDYFLED